MRDSDPRDEVGEPRFAELGMSDSDLPGIAARLPGEMKVKRYRRVQTEFSRHSGGVAQFLARPAAVSALVQSLVSSLAGH